MFVSCQRHVQVTLGSRLVYLRTFDWRCRKHSLGRKILRNDIFSFITKQASGRCRHCFNYIHSKYMLVTDKVRMHCLWNCSDVNENGSSDGKSTVLYVMAWSITRPDTYPGLGRHMASLSSTEIIRMTYLYGIMDLYDTASCNHYG